MAKFYGNIVKTGKVGSSVFRVRNGQTIESQYQPVVFNPSTQGQIAVRARMKLMAQLSTVMAPIIAMKRVGSVSPRNRFVSANFGASTYTNNEADVDLTAITLTGGLTSLPAINVTTEESTLRVALIGSYAQVDRVVYAAFLKQTDGLLRYQGSVVASEAGTSGAWPAVINTNQASIVYAYGVRFNSNMAVATFGDMQVSTADDIARVIVSSKLSSEDVTLTETRSMAVTAA